VVVTYKEGTLLYVVNCAVPDIGFNNVALPSLIPVLCPNKVV
jgi:hypothetical protein